MRLGSISEAAREFLEICVRLHKNIIVAGGTGTGKTSLLNALSTAVPDEERIVVIEDSSELRLNQPHTLYLEAQQKDAYGRGGLDDPAVVRRLAANAARPDHRRRSPRRRSARHDPVDDQRPRRAASRPSTPARPRDALVRLETLSLMSDVEIPIYVARAQVASAIHLIVQISRFTEDGSRRITRITEACGLGQDSYILQDLFVLKMQGKSQAGRIIADLQPTGTLPTFAARSLRTGDGFADPADGGFVEARNAIACATSRQLLFARQKLSIWVNTKK